MNKSVAATVLSMAATATALAQVPQGRGGGAPPVPTRSLPTPVPPAQAGNPPKSDAAVSRTAAYRQDVPKSDEEAAKADEAKAKADVPGLRGQPATPKAETPTIPLPPEPIEPYLLTKREGPFMVLAYTFRGPNAAKYAQALAMELRSKNNLPAYVFYMRIQPSASNIRNVPPTAPDVEQTGQLTAPEKYRSYDEAAVLVGNYPSIDDAEKGLKEVRGLYPACIGGPSSIWAMGNPASKHRGLSRAIATQNPLVAAELLYPGRKDAPIKPGSTLDPFAMTAAVANAPRVDPLVKRLNQGGRSLFKCPGPYTLVVAEYGGRSTFNKADPRFQDERKLKDSPLQTAHDDAEELAEILSKSEEIRRSGHKVYVFHDRSSSKVTVGAFRGVPDPQNPLLQRLDPAAEAMRKAVMEQVDLFKKKDGQLTQAKYNDKTRLVPFDSSRGEFIHLTPEMTLMPVPRE